MSRFVSPCSLLVYVMAGMLMPGVVAAPVRPGKQGPPGVKPPKTPAQVLRGHKGGIFSVSYAPDGKTLATSGKDGNVQIWNAGDGKELLTLKGHKGSVYRCLFSPDGKILASSGSDNTIRLWEPNTGRELHALRGHSGDVYNIAFTPDGKTMATASFDHSVRLWESATGKSLATLQGHGDRAIGLSFSPDGRTLASCSSGSTTPPQDEIRLWNVADGSLQYVVPGTTKGAIAVAFSPDGRRLAATMENGEVKVWETVTAREALTLKGHTQQAYHLLFSPCGRWLASCSGSWSGDKAGEVKIWSLADGREEMALAGYSTPIWSLSFSPDGKRLATATGKWSSGTQPGEVWVWDLSSLTGKENPDHLASPADLKQWWQDLQSDDGRRVYHAVWSLGAAPDQSLPFLLEHVRIPSGATRKQIAKWIVALDDDDFQAREDASTALARLGSVAIPALKEALQSSSSAEVRRRAELLLESTSAGPALSADEVLAFRVMETLEHMPGEDLRPVLRKLASGPAMSPATREAQAFLKRLQTKESSAPSGK